MSFYNWSTTALSNSIKPGINLAEGQAPATLNNSIRQMMADLAGWYADEGVVNVKKFGVVADGVVNDTVALQAALDALDDYVGLYFPPGQYKFNGCLHRAGVDHAIIAMNGAEFLIGDTGTAGSFSTNGGPTTSGKIGFLFDDCNHLSIIGTARFIGQGTLGTTSLAGMVFNECHDLICDQAQSFENMAAGRFVIYCDRPTLGDVVGYNLDGLQTFESPPTSNAGTTEVVDGCRYGRSGDANLFNGEKPTRYLTVGSGRNNVQMKFGSSICSGNGTSATASALAIRSAVECYFESAIARNGCASALLLVQYLGDQAAGYGLSRINVHAVIGETGPTGAAVDNLITVQSDDVSAMGPLRVDVAIGHVLGEYGIINNAGQLEIGYCEMSGAAPNLIATYATDAAYAPATTIQRYVQNQHTGAGAPLVVGKQGSLTIESILITEGPTHASATTFCRYDSTYGTGAVHRGIHLGDISYTNAGTAHNYTYLLYDPAATAGPALASIRNVIKSDATAEDMNLAGELLWARQGQLRGTAKPTAGVWRAGDWIQDVTPVSGQPMGWACGTAGTPGTWIDGPHYP